MRFLVLRANRAHFVIVDSDTMFTKKVRLKATESAYFGGFEEAAVMMFHTNRAAFILADGCIWSVDVKSGKAAYQGQLTGQCLSYAVNKKSRSCYVVTDEKDCVYTIGEKEAVPSACLMTPAFPKVVQYDSLMQLLYILCAGESCVYLVDTKNDEEAVKIKLPENPLAFAQHKEMLWVFFYQEGRKPALCKLNMQGKVLARRTVDVYPGDCYLTMHGEKLYVSDLFTGKICIFDTDTLIEEQTLYFLKPQKIITADEYKEELYLYESDGQNLAVLSTRNGKVKKRFGLGFKIADVCALR